jgi:mono/diheme cytochrome c family protein
MKFLMLLLSVVIVGGLGAVAFVHFGVFNIAADDPHSKLVYWLAETVRDRSIAMRAKDIKIPNLDDAVMITSGGADYNEMCTGCHLQPGVTESEMSEGMYPQPPNLSKPIDATPEEMFWVIKHGIKMSGMPAWGMTHDDARMWAMVAFIKQMPRLTPVQYQILTAPSENDMSGHEHGAEPDGMKGMKGMSMSPEARP